MWRFRKVSFAGLLAALWLPTAAVFAAVDRPNFVIIMADQQSPHVLGCAGDRVVRTPNLDRLAAAGFASRPTTAARRCACRPG